MRNYNYLTAFLYFSQITNNSFKNKFTIKIIFWLVYQ